MYTLHLPAVSCRGVELDFPNETTRSDIVSIIARYALFVGFTVVEMLRI